MKTTTMKKFLAVAFAAAFASAFADYIDIPSGATVTITDATVDDYAGGINFVDATGVVEFNTSAAPTMDIKGAGTVKKTSNSSSWTMSRQIKNFSGDYILSGGGVVTATGDADGSARYFFGNDTGALTILAGNTLYAPNVANMPMFYDKRVKVAGTGVNGRGAIHTLSGSHNMKDTFLRKLTLLDDATLQYQTVSLQFIANSDIVMDGHELTYLGNAYMDHTGASTYSSDGTIRLKGTSGDGMQFKIRSKWMNFGESEGPFVIDDYGAIYFYYDGASLHDYYPIKRPLTVKGTHGFIGVLQQNQTSPCTYTNLKANVWASKITLEPGSKLDMRNMLLRQQFNLAGQVTGDGSVTTGGGPGPSNRKNLGRVYLANTNNTYKGYTYVNNAFDGSKIYGQFLAAGPRSIPNYSSLTGSWGMVALRMKERESDDELLWTDGTYIRDLANGGTWLNGCGIGFNTEFLGKDLVLNYPAGITNPDATVGGVAGPHDILLTNVVGTAEHPFRLHQMGGKMTVKTKPGAPQYLGDVRVSTALWNQYGVTDGLICIEDSDIIVPPEGNLFIGYNRPVYDAKNTAFEFWGTNTVVQLKNTRLIAEHLTNDWPEEMIRSDALIVGSSAEAGSANVGMLEVYDGSVVTGRLIVAGRVYGGYGAVVQYGGSVTAIGSDEWNTSSQIGSGKASSMNSGYYELRGGEFVSAGRLGVGVLQTGFFAQYGGTFRMTSKLGSTSRPQFGININNGGQLASGLYVAGGTFDLGSVNADINMNGRWSGSEFHAFVAVEGEGTFVDFGTRAFAPNVVAAAHADITLANGGRFRTAGFHKGNADSKIVVNFNGGIWECSWDRTGVAGGDDIFHIERTSYPGKGADNVLVYDGGMTVDTAGKEGLGTYRPITGATGNGVTGLSSGFAPFYCGLQPIVRISGDGVGAVAVAEWSKETGMVTGIKVLAPGSGYTTATAKFCHGGTAGNATDCTLAANANAGGFAKAGEGTFLLAATNTYGGATIVKGGTLKANCDWAIPTNSTVVLAGGNLDFNNKTGEVASVTYGVGGGQILNAGNVKMPGTSTFSISTAELAAGKSVDLTGDVDLSKVTIVVTGDASLLDKDVRYTVATTGGTFSGTPTKELDPSLAKWGVKVRPQKITLSIPRGLVVYVR